MMISENDVKMMKEAEKIKLRKQMHHDLCVLSAGSANVAFTATAERAMEIYKALWLQVMKEIP